MGKVEKWEFEQRCGFPLELKVQLTNARIVDWYEHYQGRVYVSFSGGKDSTALLHLVRDLYPDVLAVFVDTGLEYPEIRDFVKTIDNVVWLKPKMVFSKIIKKYGYPVVSKEVSQKIYEVRNTKSDKLRHKRMYGDDNKYKSGKIPEKWKPLIESPFKISDRCCHYLKKQPSMKFEKDTGLMPFIGTMAQDSHLRHKSYLNSGCNSFDSKRPKSTPLAFWKEEDVWDYIKMHNVDYSKIYDMGYDRTGCMFCMFGVHLETGVNRFQRMKQTHPAQYSYCIKKLGCGEVLDFIGVKY